jgi:hypothetical protein
MESFVVLPLLRQILSENTCHVLKPPGSPLFELFQDQRMTKHVLMFSYSRFQIYKLKNTIRFAIYNFASLPSFNLVLIDSQSVFRYLINYFS